MHTEMPGSGNCFSCCIGQPRRERQPSSVGGTYVLSSRENLINSNGDRKYQHQHVNALKTDVDGDLENVQINIKTDNSKTFAVKTGSSELCQLQKMDSKTSGELATLISRLETVADKFEAFVDAKQSGSSAGASGAASAGSEPLAAFVMAFDDLLNGSFKQYVTISNQIGGDVKTQATFVADGFKAQRGFLEVASKSKEPAQDVLIKLLGPTSEKVTAVQDFREKNRRSEFFNHLSALSESIPALGWVTVAPTPAPYVKEMADAGQFYLNRVLKDFKEKDKSHVDWVKAWQAFLTELQAYIKNHHTTGVTWNKQGVAASSAPPPAPAAPSGGAPPPPPPPPPANLADSGDDQEAKRSQLFSDLNKGADITKGLRKVTDDQKTHKNPKLRTTAQPFKPATAPKPFKPFNASPTTAKKEEVVKPPKCELEGKKWIVEYQVNNKNVVVNVTEKKHTVYIYKCTNSTIQVKGKANSITLDGCKKTAVVFEDVISTFDVINCQSVQAQVTTFVPTLNIDKTDGCQVYLNKESAGAEIITAKSSEMNILVPDDSGEFKEYAIPEQFVTKFVDGKLQTQASSINM